MVSPLWFWLLAQAASGNAPPSKQEQMLEWLSGNPTIGWGIAIFAVLAMAVAAVAKLTGNLDNIIGFFEKYRPKKREITEEERQKLRRQLIDVVLRQVVKRLEDSLHHKIRMDLRYQEERQRVGRRDLPPVENSRPLDQFIRRAVNSFGKPASSTPVETDVSTATLLKRDDIKGRLLILGEPGAGKTNELLAVAKELLQQAQQSDDAPIPVIFELSEWSSEQGETFADWLIEQLQQKYTVPPKVAQQWIDQNQLFPLLDGLDELRRVDSAENVSSEEIDRKQQAKQIQCMRAINAFLDVHPSMSMVVCCRRKEYEVLEAQGEYLKRLNGAIYLQELDDEQIKSYLEDSNRGPLWDSLVSQPELLKLARSPLFLLMLVVAYQGQPIQNIDELLNLYIEKQLTDLNNHGAYAPGKAPTPEKTHYYLSWLATKLEKQEVTEFLIERLQPSFLDRECNRKEYRLAVGITVGIIVGITTIVAVGLPFGLLASLMRGLIYGLIFGLFFGLAVSLGFESFFAFFNPDLTNRFRRRIERIINRDFGAELSAGISDIKPAENINFSWTLALKIGLIFGLIGGIFGLMSLLLPNGLTDGLIGGLSLGLICGLIGGLMGGLTSFESEIEEKQLPNQGIKQSVKSSIIIGLIIWLMVGLIGWLIGLVIGLPFGIIGSLISGRIFGWVIGLVIGLPLGLIGSLISGLLQIIRHLVLRFVLYKAGVSPWNYAKFLEHAENHRFIQRVGGRYRFVHDLLRKRFAERYQPKWR